MEKILEIMSGKLKGIRAEKGYTQEEINKILNRFRYNDTFTCSFLTSCYTGMQTGEVFALTWDDIDLENGTISVKHSVYNKTKDEKGRWFIGSTKTISGEKIIFISPTLLSALRNYKRKKDYLKELYGNSYIYYYLEDVKNEYGKVVEQRKRPVISSSSVNNGANGSLSVNIVSQPNNTVKPKEIRQQIEEKPTSEKPTNPANNVMTMLEVKA